jgi:hypothetical protein
LKNIQILWCLLKYIYLPLKIHSYILHTLKYFPNTFLYFTYINIPSKYIAIPSLHTFGILYNTIKYSNMLPYMLKLSWNLSNPHIFVLPLYCLPKLSWYLIILPKYFYIFHEFHKSYWFVKYLNPKLISWDIINTCWTYICWSQKLLTT